MSFQYKAESFGAAQIIEIIVGERTKALSVREWKHRIAGYGYGIKETAHGQMVTAWPSGQEICAMPVDVAA